MIASNAAAPRLARVNDDLVASDAAAATNSALLGLDLGLDVQTRMGRPVGVAAGFNVAPGWLFGHPDPASQASGAFGVWTAEDQGEAVGARSSAAWRGSSGMRHTLRPSRDRQGGPRMRRTAAKSGGPRSGQGTASGRAHQVT